MIAILQVWFLYINFISCKFTEFIYWFQQFFDGVFRAFICNITSSANSDSFTSSCLIWMPFFFLVWLLWLELPILCWIKVARVGILVLFLILEEMLSVFTIEYVSYELVLYDFVLLRYVPSVLCWKFFLYNHKWMLNFVKYFFYIYWDNCMIFIICFVNKVRHLDDFWMLSRH